MKVLIVLVLQSIFLLHCAKKKEQATVGLPYGIHSLSKDTLRFNDTIEIRGYYLNYAPINETKVFFNGVPGQLLYMDIHFARVIVPQTSSGLLLYQQRDKSTSIHYRFQP